MLDVLYLVLGLMLSAVMGATVANVFRLMDATLIESLAGGSIVALIFGAFAVHWYFLSPFDRCLVDLAWGLTESCWVPPMALP